jgi:hypothetical protein
MCWSTTQAVVALSSGEAELYSLTKGAANTLGMMSLGADFGMTFHAKVSSDSSAAIGMVNRTGAGKLRHIRVQYLWIQDVVRSGQLGLDKVPGADNPADLLTKHVDARTMAKHTWLLGFEVLSDRAESAPTLNMLLQNLESMGESVPEGAAKKFVGINSEDERFVANILNVENSNEAITVNISNVANFNEDKLNNKECNGDREADSLRGREQIDGWKNTGLWMVREHRRARKELFTPLRVAGSPPAKTLTPTRVTRGRFVGGETFCVTDTWTSRACAHRALSRPWIGSTFFLLRSPDITESGLVSSL